MPRPDQVYHKRELEKDYCYAQAVKAGNTLYISGCVSWDTDGNVIGEGDMGAQGAAAYTDIKEALEAHGGTFQNVVKETVFTTDMDALEENNHIRTQFYTDAGSGPPASTWIGCTRLADTGMMIEVECIAVIE